MWVNEKADIINLAEKIQRIPVDAREYGNKRKKQGMHKKIKRIAVLSDTHGLLRQEVVETLEGCSAILHGGDINRREILEELGRIAPVYAVRGNNDKEWAEGMPEELELTLFGIRIYMVHNKKYRKADLQGTDLFIYGHSHKYGEKTEDGIRFLNPGSCGPRRFRQPVTMAVLEVEEDTGAWAIRKIDLTEDTGGSPAGVTAGNVKRTVEIIIREMKTGHKVDAIAGRLGVEQEFVEQVCRIYVTHPGVDAQGIINKMEVSALFERR